MNACLQIGETALLSSSIYVGFLGGGIG
jgi:hypothetical protein